MLAVLRRRNFALLWFGGLLSMIGDWVLITALPFALYQRTGSALAASGYLMASLLPSFLLGSVAGVFVDRWDRRRTMIVADLLRAGLLGTLLISRDGEHLWLVYAVVACQSAVSAFFGPAENALLPTLVEEAALVPANSLNVLNNNLARLLGPPLGGAVFGLLGLHGVLLFDAVSFVLSGVLIALVAVPPAVGSPDRARVAPGKTWAAVGSEWLAGFGVIRRSRLIAGVFAVAGLAGFADCINSALLVPFVDTVLRGGAQGFGWLLSIQAIGGLFGSVVIGRTGDRLSPDRLLALSMVAVGTMSLVLVRFPSLTLALVFSALGGVTAVGYLVSQQTLLQRNVPDHFRGRVFGAWDTTNAFLRLAALALAGGFGDIVGILPLLYVMGGLRVLAGVLAHFALSGARPKPPGHEVNPPMA